MVFIISILCPSHPELVQYFTINGIKNCRQISYFEVAIASSTGEKSNARNWTNSSSSDLQVNTNWVSSARQTRVTKGTYATRLEFMLRIIIKFKNK